MSAAVAPVVKDAFLDLAWRLSPGELTGDGRLTPGAVREKATALWGRWAGLEKRCGRKVEQAEVTGWWLERYEAERT